jgi:zeaxanthin glucosyltransferase
MRIVFKIYPQKSHYNATFPMAKDLQKQGNEIIYTGLRQLKAHVEAQGFTFHVEEEDIFPYCEDKRENMPQTFWEMLLMWPRLRKWNRASKAKWLRCDLLEKLVKEIKPDQFYVDSPYSFFALALYKTGVRFGILESMMVQDRAPGCPPLDTDYVPTGSWFSNRICDLYWYRLFLKRWILGALELRLDYSKSLVRKVAKVQGVDFSVIVFDRYFHIGLSNVPEYILSPQHLDFPRKLKANQIYVNHPINLDRVETCGDFTFNERFEKFVEERKNGRPLVYCSLGTAGWRYKGAEKFLQRVVEASSGADWNLILAIGELNRDSFNNPPTNVEVFQTVPQLKVLKQSDLMITHGGMNSISECNALNVQMIICPGSKEIDQNGNAARVVYHKLGLFLELDHCNAKNISNSINILLKQ